MQFGVDSRVTTDPLAASTTEPVGPVLDPKRLADALQPDRQVTLAGVSRVRQVVSGPRAMPDRRRRQHAKRRRKTAWPSGGYSTASVDRVDPRDPVRARANRRLLMLLIVLRLRFDSGVARAGVRPTAHLGRTARTDCAVTPANSRTAMTFSNPPQRRASGCTARSPTIRSASDTCSSARWT